MKAEILRILRDSTGFVSGQELCSRLGVSRTAVWKAVNQLKESGYNIEAVPNKGYTLLFSPDLMTKEEIKSRLNTAFIGQRTECYEELDSTNTTAKYLAEEGVPHGTIVVAEQQKAGKGRRGRGWSSIKGSGIWMSILIRPNIKPINASMLSLVAAMAVNKGIRQLTGFETFIKWPNDVVLNKKKICGILTEMSAELDYINHIVIGIGVNTTIKQFPKELELSATSLYLEGCFVQRSELMACILNEFETYYNKFIETCSMEYLMEEYNHYLINGGREVKIQDGENEFTAFAKGIDKKGELIINKQDGSETAIIAGEVSVRGLYGYV